jgi:hypothetical protein
MPGASYVKRYVLGECQAVTRELIALGPLVRQEPVYSEAREVSREIVRRARHNLRLLHSHLIELGYEFKNPDDALVDAGPEAGAQLDAIETENGVLPVIVRAWYEELASVDFSQAEHQVWCKEHDSIESAPAVYGLGGHCLLAMKRIELGLVTRAEMKKNQVRLIEEWRSYGWIDQADWLTRQEARASLETGDVASNCEPVRFELPELAFDAQYRVDCSKESCVGYLITDLREAFRWGGFPFAGYIQDNPQFCLPSQYRPNLTQLLPVLNEGLLDL